MLTVAGRGNGAATETTIIKAGIVTTMAANRSEPDAGTADCDEPSRQADESLMDLKVTTTQEPLGGPTVERSRPHGPPGPGA